MRAAVLIVIVCAALFTAFMMRGGDRTTPVPDLESVRTHPLSMPGWVSGLGALASPFAPKLRLEGGPFELDPSTPLEISISTSTKRSRIAKLQLSKGEAVSVSYAYDCKSQGEGAPSCPQELCLVADQSTVPAECPQGGTAQNNGSVIAKGVGGTLTLRAIGGPAEVEAE